MTIQVIPASPEVTAHAERIETEAMYKELTMSYVLRNSDEFHGFIASLRPISRLHPERSSR